MDFSTLGSTIVVIVIAVLVLLILVLTVPAGIARHQRTQKQKLLAQKGAFQLGKCPLCDGALEPGELFAGEFRARGRRHPIGAVRCTECGHTSLFS